MSDEPVDLNLEELKELIKLLRESHVSEFELRKADYRLRIKQGQVLDASTVRQPEAGSKLIVVPQSGNGPAEDVGQDEEQAAVVPTKEQETLHEIRSPMVGTFFRSSTPGTAPLVEVGDTIRPNQVLCIIEAMKIMNEIEADMGGEVRKIHVTNGQPVEFGELLFSIRPLS
jgi:acetyl-CoA carboxylase biotin carboxyl carrier protein